MGYGLGGLLSGIGAGLSKSGELDILARREQALQRLKDQQAAADDARTAAAQTARDDLKFGRDKELAVLGAGLDMKKQQNASNLKVTQEIPAQTRSDLAVEGAKSAAQLRLEAAKTDGEMRAAQFRNGLDIAKDAESQRLRHMYDAGEIKDVMQAPDGTWQIIRNNGVIYTSKTKGLIRQSLTDGSDAAVQRILGEAGSKPVAKPAGGGLLSPQAGPLASATAAVPSVGPDASQPPENVYTQADLTALVNEAIGKRTRGDARFVGKTDNEVAAIIRAGLKAQGAVLSAR
jgi:hypothetical protein